MAAAQEVLTGQRPSRHQGQRGPRSGERVRRRFWLHGLRGWFLMAFFCRVEFKRRGQVWGPQA